MDCLNISIKGIVQGVGFRPFIYSLANELSLKGFVANTSDGVVITVEGNNLENFIERIRTESPPLSNIMSFEISPDVAYGYKEFSIKESYGTGRFTLVSPDISVCQECLDEMFDKEDRRYLYPFINCTNCGPRYSITRSVPYDRINTTMNVFNMCNECESEYHNPSDRRFHAQPNACPVCGPQVELRVKGEKLKFFKNINPIRKSIQLLNEGKIVAIKGLGGFHIACDATKPDAVEELRERKRRSNKPFALMAPDLPSVRKFCHVSAEEEALLHSPNRPIVLLKKRAGVSLPDMIAPQNSYLGFMLPYTPLHYLLFYSEDKRSEPHFPALVMTSGNISEEPIIIDNEEAVSKLSLIADAFLVHNRQIYMRVDDSVVKVKTRRPVNTTLVEYSYHEVESQEKETWSNTLTPINFFLRRSRSFAPNPVPLQEDGPDVLGCGADIKNTFTLTKGSYAIPSQHIGDMENYETLKFFEETLDNLKKVYRAEPVAIAYDLHPQYLSTRWALGQGEKSNKERINTYGIQHHYAHIGSVMAENGLKEKVIGVSFDGNGYGQDGKLWGGEFLLSDLTGFKRAGHIRYTPLPGGEMAIREPWRTALSYLKEATGDEIWDYIEPTGFIERYGKDLIEKILMISEKREFSPLSSGAGRLFDAVSALLGICDKNTYEGEAAIALESLVLGNIDEDYFVDISFRDTIEIDFSHAFLQILQDISKDKDRRLISTKFHNTVASVITRVVLKISLISNIRKVVLTGGVFQNLYLLRMVSDILRAEGMTVYLNELVPCNDAGISLGQAYIIRERLKEGII